MAEHAHLTSLEALDAFRSNLIVYLNKARPAVEDVTGEIYRLRVWLQHDQKLVWEGELRRRMIKLQLAEQALSNARVSNPGRAGESDMLMVRRAAQAVEEAREKLKLLKRWDREFDNRVEPLAKQLNRVMNLMTMQMPQATAYLAQMIKTLAEYSDISPAGTTAPNPIAEESAQSDAEKPNSDEKETGQA